MTEFRICGLVPTYDNPMTIRSVVERVRAHLADVIVVDDGSADPGRIAVEALGREGLARVLRRSRNGGKGAAVKDGLRFAAELGFTHCLQIDADGQHDAGDIPRLLAASRARPDALILGQPVFDGSAPSLRRKARLISRFLTDLQTGKRVIQDPLCGFRVYPVQAATRGRMSPGMRLPNIVPRRKSRLIPAAEPFSPTSCQRVPAFAVMRVSRGAPSPAARAHRYTAWCAPS